MVKLTYKGKVVFTSRMMQELCHITDAILSRYSTKPDNPLLQENEDYIIINLEEFNEFTEENSDKNN